jgi:ribosomal protein S18 acetylase RimI-like enzyme
VSSIFVRPAVPADFDRVAALTVDAYRAGGQLAVETGYERVLADVASRAAVAEVLVAESDRGIVGSVAFVLPDSPYAELCGPGEAEFRMLAVDPTVQGRGIGEALVRACIARARAVDASAMRLSTSSIMVAARGLYERLGFVRTPERDWSPLPDVELLAFRLDLRGSADEVEGDTERRRSALVIGDPRVPQDEPAGVQGEDRQR